MSTLLKVKMILNKRNGQMNISLPKKDLPRELKSGAVKKFLKMRIEGWE